MFGPWLLPRQAHAAPTVPGRFRRALACAAAGLAMLAAPASVQAQATEVDLQLVLAVDVSRSMDADEQALQRDGYVQAFLHTEVIEAVLSGFLGRIAVAYIEWAGSGLADVVVPWTVIDGAEAAAAFAARINAAPLRALQRTSISGGLTFAAAMLERSGFTSTRRVIDISGDGANNAGPPVTAARDAVLARGIVINGLPVMLKQGGGPYSFFDIPDLDLYYEDCVIGGPGAFIVTVSHVSEFAEAIRKKLVLEIAGAEPAPTMHRHPSESWDLLGYELDGKQDPSLRWDDVENVTGSALRPSRFRGNDDKGQWRGRPEVIPIQAQQNGPRVDCYIGERIWERFMRGVE